LETLVYNSRSWVVGLVGWLVGWLVVGGWLVGGWWLVGWLIRAFVRQTVNIYLVYVFG